jgi:hypothetical protein
LCRLLARSGWLHPALQRRRLARKEQLAPHTLVSTASEGDGKPDLAVANSGSNYVSILLGNGDGTFRPPVQIGSYLNNVQVAVGDFNLDHNLDLVVLDAQSSATDPAPLVFLWQLKQQLRRRQPHPTRLV